MSGPPADIPPDALWMQITAMPRPTRLVDFPRKDPITGEPMATLVMQVLTQEEWMSCAADAEKFTRELLKNAPKNDEARRGYDSVYDNAASLEILFRACRREKDPKIHFFPSVSAIRKALSADEVGVLMRHYLTAQLELGPIIARLDEKEVDAWVERLAEGGSSVPLDLLSLDELKTLALTLALRLHSSSTAISSPGSPPAESTSSESIESNPEQGAEST